MSFQRNSKAEKKKKLEFIFISVCTLINVKIITERRMKQRLHCILAASTSFILLCLFFPLLYTFAFPPSAVLEHSLAEQQYHKKQTTLLPSAASTEKLHRLPLVSDNMNQTESV